MGENIDPTWLCFHSPAVLDETDVHARAARVAEHYAQLVDYPLRTSVALAGGVGTCVVGDAEPACRWPFFASNSQRVATAAYLATGWTKITGEGLDPTESSLGLAGALEAEPDRASRELNAPLAIGIVNREMQRLTVVNDAIGAARVYEMESQGLTVWSNRPGALVRFLEISPKADERAWLVLAAASWLLGDCAPIDGMTRLPAGSVVVADRGGIERSRTRAAEMLVRDGRSSNDLVEAATDDALRQARTAAEIWPGQAKVDLSGGRDSRLAAAAMVAAGTDSRFLTSDATPGEADIARQVIAAAPRPLTHEVTKTQAGSATPSTPLLERAANLHLLHDGVRHPQKLRGKMTLPRPRPRGATISGHGGEIAHGFFYKTRKQVRSLRWGRGRVEDRVMRYFGKGEPLAQPAAYEEARREVDGVLDAGRSAGLRGPILLDWFYLMDRFAHRSGLGTDSERISVFATPGFISASFALSPRDRVDDNLHRAVIASLVPTWADVPFFDRSPGRGEGLRRDRLWEVERDAKVFEEILAGGGAWTDAYDETKVKSAWRDVRRGDGSVKWEQAFEGVVYRATFDEHLRRLAS